MQPPAAPIHTPPVTAHPATAGWTLTVAPAADVLVIGAGLAGLSAAWAARCAGSTVTVLSKGPAASAHILGFNAPVGAGDSTELFAADTRRGGWDIGDPALGRILAAGAGPAAARLESLGLAFDRADLPYHLLQPLGCSVPRLLHQGNHTGQLAMGRITAGLADRGVRVQAGWMVASLLSVGGRVAGALALAVDQPQAMVVPARAVILATGGGHFAAGSTAPAGLTGDGYALAWRAGAELLDLEFIQFEPCRCIWPQPLGISTTLLAKGGALRNALGQRFVLDYYPSEGAAPKDLLARLIAAEIRAGRGTPHGGVWLDLTGLPAAEIQVDHALYDQRFRAAGIDLTREPVEVAPAAHTFLGGIRIDNRCRTTVAGLLAAGEAAGGLHGANRLGGSAGTEVLVFGQLAGESAAADAAQTNSPAMDSLLAQAEAFLAGLNESGQPEPQNQAAEISELQTAVQAVIAGCLGPIRDRTGLLAGGDELDRLAAIVANAHYADWTDRITALETANLLLVGRLAVQAAARREETRGVHCRADFPQPDDVRWRKNICLNRQAGLMVREPGQIVRRNPSLKL